MAEDVRPFAPLIGERLSFVEFVLNSSVQLRLGGPTPNAYNLPRIVIGDVEYTPKQTGLQGRALGPDLHDPGRRICDRGRNKPQVQRWAAFLISLRPEDTEGEEPAELWTEEAGRVWQATVPGITRFVKPSE